jgi:hypothetical protein
MRVHEFSDNRQSKTQASMSTFPDSPQSGDQTIQHAEIWCSAARASHDQKLMSDQDGLSNDGTKTSWAGESKNGGNEMNEQNNDIAHATS